MTMKRRRHRAQSNATFGLEAIRERKTVNELASEYGVHPTQISQWKRQVLENLPSVFSNGRQRGAQHEQALKAALYEEIGRLKMELEWVKKKAARLGGGEAHHD